MPAKLVLFEDAARSKIIDGMNKGKLGAMNEMEM